MNQLALDGLAGVSLTERQAVALRIIRDRGPISSEELGASVAEARGKRSSEDYDRSNGRALGDALAAKELARYVRGEGWVEVFVDGTDASASSQTAEIPF